MDVDEARTVKSQLAVYAGELLAGRAGATAAAVRVGVAIGLAPRPDGSFGVAVRYPLGTSTARMVARRLRAEAGPVVDVRRTGRVRPFAVRATRAPVPTARALGETGRVRPLRPGASVAHQAVSAGTLGGFVTVAGDPGTFLLSNHHVLVGPSGRAGDPVVQPAPADGGSVEDRVGSLTTFAPLTSGEPALVDAALARLDDGVEADPAYPVGALTGVAEVVGDDVVQKVGRTTGITDGHVTAIELDGLVVGYGAGVGELTFDDQIEVEGAGEQPFSAGGDSGALVYRPSDGRAVGLLFAGSETGGENGRGLTYLNPVVEVLTALGATLVQARPAAHGGASR
ncbi:S1 family peptidase [Georgenia sp. EYE_87]|uniref:S1 family peptidase n=1 Tax=Georgenia sp. EYE_87 TaxID=2853448 RepID=UPI002005461A|nr:S1 family peptidase [Georgenia sp. EYE_87]MCK6209602.1 S1 family peptidase [Georgenia sp. EYE_87]